MMPRLRDLNDEALLAEWHVWNDKARATTDSWVAVTATGFRNGCEAEMHDRGISVPPSPQTTEEGR